MRNIQVIEPAENCKYEIYAATDEEFALFFPDGADIEFIEDFIKRVGKHKAGAIGGELWKRPVEKANAQGIHGTLFYQLKKMKKEYYPNKRFSDDRNG